MLNGMHLWGAAAVGVSVISAVLLMREEWLIAALLWFGGMWILMYLRPQ